MSGFLKWLKSIADELTGAKSKPTEPTLTPLQTIRKISRPGCIAIWSSRLQEYVPIAGQLPDGVDYPDPPCRSVSFVYSYYSMRPSARKAKQ